MLSQYSDSVISCFLPPPSPLPPAVPVQQWQRVGRAGAADRWPDRREFCAPAPPPQLVRSQMTVIKNGKAKSTVARSMLPVNSPKTLRSI
jgi:hypothetical protein